jgi:hypothetical protein
MDQEEKARILREARETLERTDPKRRQQWRWGRDEPPDPRPGWRTAENEPITCVPLVSSEPMDRYRREAEEQAAIAEAERIAERYRREEARQRAAEAAAEAAARVLNPDDVLQALRRCSPRSTTLWTSSTRCIGS